MSVVEGVQRMMERFDQEMNHVFSGGDPMLMQWFLVRETYLPFLLSGIYLLFCFIGPTLMRNRKPFDLRECMIVYNFAIVTVYIGFVTVTVISLPNARWKDFCDRATVRYDDYSYTVTYGAWLAYLIKYVEYMDTVFFVLRKKTKQMSFLHICHHTVLPLVGWILFRTQYNGVIYVPIVTNSLIHIIMYFYYGMAAMGPRVQKYLLWKKYLTQLQLTHFWIIFLFMVLVSLLTECDVNRMEYNLILMLNPFFFYLFYKFYQDTYRQKKD